MKLKFSTFLLLIALFFSSCDLFGPAADISLDLDVLPGNNIGLIDGSLVYEFIRATEFYQVSEYYTFTVSESGYYKLNQESAGKWGDMSILDVTMDTSGYDLVAGTEYFLHVDQGSYYGENIRYTFYR